MENKTIMETPILTKYFVKYSCQSSSISLTLCLSEVYLFKYSTRFVGNIFAIITLARSILFKKKGVVKIVKTETKTITGYRKPLVTPSAVPKAAIMKENSPI